MLNTGLFLPTIPGLWYYSVKTLRKKADLHAFLVAGLLDGKIFRWQACRNIGPRNAYKRAMSYCTQCAINKQSVMKQLESSGKAEVFILQSD